MVPHKVTRAVQPAYFRGVLLPLRGPDGLPVVLGAFGGRGLGVPGGLPAPLTPVSALPLPPLLEPLF